VGYYITSVRTKQMDDFVKRSVGDAEDVDSTSGCVTLEKDSSTKNGETSNFDDIYDEDELKAQLEESTDFEVRRKIRARLRQLKKMLIRLLSQNVMTLRTVLITVNILQQNTGVQLPRLTHPAMSAKITIAPQLFLRLNLNRQPTRLKFPQINHRCKLQKLN